MKEVLSLKGGNMCAVHSALSNLYVVNQATGMQLCKQFSNFRFLAKIIYSLNIEIFAMVSSQDLGSSGGKHCKSVENTYGVVSPFKVDF